MGADQRPIHFGGAQLPPLQYDGANGATRLRAPVLEVELPPVEWHGAVGIAPGADVPLHHRYRTLKDVLDAMPESGPERVEYKRDHFGAIYGAGPGAIATALDHANPPAGEASPEARLVNVSRMALAARIKHGVPLVDMLNHFQTLALLEERLRSYQE